MNNIPSGTVTFLFTDIEGSTKLAQQYPDAMPILLTRHHEILRAAIQAQNGYIFQNEGDSLSVAFHSALDAVRAASNAQQQLQQEAWSPAPIKVRMGIHTGAAQLNEPSAPTTYTGYTTLATTARIMSAGHGGQILLSGATRELIRDSLPADSELKDLGEKRLKDLLRPERLYQLNIAGLPTTFLPLKTLDSFPNNLPQQLTSFIGRENEIAGIRQELESHRLVTLTGSGGTGKTRLSLQVAAELLDQFQHGIWFIELAPLTNPDLIPQTILSAIGIQEQQDKTPLDSLKEYLRERQSLIVLDNCEHLIEASARVTETLLHASPKVKIMASSREALGVHGEFTYPVPSLSAPDPKHMPDIEGLSRYEAVRLFADRANLSTSHFAVEKNNASFVAQICHRLDGIPLALELAAARVKVLSVEQIAKRLDDRFSLLTGGARTALPRQQTLRATIDWSYNLLSKQEKTLLRRLAVFIGGWTLEATEEVCSGDEIEIDQILDLLSQLVNKSLVTVEMTRGEARYGILETVRQYAREKLFDTDEALLMRDKHLDFFVKLAEQAEPELYGSNQVLWFNRLDKELDNFRMALEWSLRIKNGESALRIVGSLGQFWWTHNHLKEGREWINQATETRTGSKAQAKALYWGSVLARTQEDFITARRLSNESLELFRILADMEGMAKALGVLGSIEYFEKEFVAAQNAWEEALALYRELADRRGIARVLNNLGYSAQTQGNIEKAQELYIECLAICRELEDKWNMQHVLYNMGLVAYQQENIIKAREFYEESLELCRELSDKDGQAYALLSLAQVLFSEGQPVSSAQVQGRATLMLKDVGSFLEPIEQANFNKNVAALIESIGMEKYEREFEAGKALSLEQAFALALRKV